MKMKAIVIYKAGDAHQLQLEERPIPTLKQGWTLVKIKGFGINRSEIFTRQGHSPSVVFPRILGIECVGIVEATTSPTLTVGQTVVSLMGEMGRAFDGSYAEYTLLPNTQVYPITTTLSWSDLAAVPETYYTAFGSMQNLQIKPTDTVLVRAAASGVAIAFLRLIKAQYPALRVVGSIRNHNTEKEAALLRIGYDAIITDTNNTLDTDERFDKILELVGPTSIKDSFAHIKEHGIICATGLLGGKWYLEDFDPTRDLLHNAYLTTFYSGTVNAQKITTLFAYIDQHHVPVAPEKIFPLEDIVAAHQYLESSEGYGKVIVRIP